MKKFWGFLAVAASIITILTFALDLWPTGNTPSSTQSISNASGTGSGASTPIAPPEQEEAPQLSENNDTNLLSLTPTWSSSWHPSPTRHSVQLWHAGGSMHSAQPYSSFRRVEFYIGARYSLLRGVIFADEHLNPNSRIQFRIYGEGSGTLYTSPVIERATSFEFEVNVSGVRYISIYVENRPYRIDALAVTASGEFTASDLWLIR